MLALLHSNECRSINAVMVLSLNFPQPLPPIEEIRCKADEKKLSGFLLKPINWNELVALLATLNKDLLESPETSNRVESMTEINPRIHKSTQWVIGLK